MILIITHKEDFTADFLIEKLNIREIPYFRLNCEDILSEIYSIKISSTTSININGITEFDSVWFRRMKLPDLNFINRGEREFLLKDYDTLFENLFQLIKVKNWVSHPDNVFRAENKLLQLSEAVSLGFTIPETIVTNSQTELVSFCKGTDSQFIVKPIRQGRVQMNDGFKNIFTNVLDPNTIAQLSDFDLTPCIVQKYIDKKYELRITVVKDKVFAVKIDSQTNQNTIIDWRREKLPLTPYFLPKKFEQMCIMLLKKLNISFGAIDMVLDKNGEYIFLEINPNGQWAWIEIEAGINISDAIIHFLTNDHHD